MPFIAVHDCLNVEHFRYVDFHSRIGARRVSLKRGGRRTGELKLSNNLLLPCRNKTLRIGTLRQIFIKEQVGHDCLIRGGVSYRLGKSYEFGF